MPEVMVRRRPAAAPASVRHRLNRWIHRLRPQLAVIIAFAIACVLGVVAASIGVKTLDSGPSHAEAQQESP
jgi:hypothetical protein